MLDRDIERRVEACITEQRGSGDEIGLTTIVERHGDARRAVRARHQRIADGDPANAVGAKASDLSLERVGLDDVADIAWIAVDERSLRQLELVVHQKRDAVHGVATESRDVKEPAGASSACDRDQSGCSA